MSLKYSMFNIGVEKLRAKIKNISIKHELYSLLLDDNFDEN